MTNRKNYNSILFLTVYLGLVLVGATPQVLAHAATNSFFDLRNEIEFKDDLDTKPDDIFTEIELGSEEKSNYFFNRSNDIEDEKFVADGITFRTNFPVREDGFADLNLSYRPNLQSRIFQSEPQKVVYENTKITSQKNQIFIVTRLPRGSIDSLLKQ
jgi:hypothetical protein